MGEVSGWSTADSSNTDLFPEGMAPSAVNDSGRAVQGAVARWFKDTNGSVDASGSANAFAITSNRTIAALADDLVMAFTANHTVTGAATLNLNGLGAKAIKRFNGNALATGDIVSGQPVVAIYKLSSDVWFMMSAAAADTGNSFADFDENAAPGNPAANDARLYAKDDGNGTTVLAYRDTAGVEKVLGHQGELIAIVEDRKAQNTAAQSLTGGSDNVRELTTLAFNRNTLVSLASNRFTLPAGTWEIAWVSPLALTAGGLGAIHQSFLFNQSDSTEVARGTSGQSDGADTDAADGQDSSGSAVVTISGSKAFEVRHRTDATVRGGVPANFGAEVYTRVTVRRA